MSVSLRLSRGGSKKRPFFRIVAADVRAPRDGRYLERLGTYNPMKEKSDPERVTLNKDRIKYSNHVALSRLNCLRSQFEFK